MGLLQALTNRVAVQLYKHLPGRPNLEGLQYQDDRGWWSIPR
jgi:hypothetical protein